MEKTQESFEEFNFSEDTEETELTHIRIFIRLEADHEETLCDSIGRQSIVKYKALTLLKRLEAIIIIIIITNKRSIMAAVHRIFLNLSSPVILVWHYPLSMLLYCKKVLRTGVPPIIDFTI